MVQPLWKTAWGFLKKLKIEVPHDPAILLLGIYLKKPETLIRKDMYIPMLIAALPTTAEIWRQPMCPSTDGWIKRCGIYVHTQNGILLGHKK